MTGDTVVLSACLIASNIAAWLWAWSVFGARPDLLALAFLAWVFGLRHAVDADHIAAIDNAVRKLLQAGQRPSTVGLHFSLGHSTVVILASVAIAAAAGGMHTWLDGFQAIGARIGAIVSAAFLLVIALMNLNILVGLLRGTQQEPRAGGLLSRILRPLMRLVGRSWHMYPIGFLFGLGFDTATEVGLLGIAATQAAQGLPTWYILVFPALFTAGMTLVDTADGVLMLRAYSWAVGQPRRRRLYNLTITAVSVVVALVIGGIEALGLIGPRFASLGDMLTNAGFLIVGLFLVIWGAYAVVPLFAAERDR